MNITICTGPSFPVPPLQGGAMCRLWLGLAREFVQRGHPTTIYSRAYPGLPDEEELDGITILRRGGFPQQSASWKNLTLDFFYALRHAPGLPTADITVFNDFWLPALAPRLNRQLGKTVISANRFPKHQYPLYRNISLVVPCSAAIHRNILAQSPFPPGRLVTIHNPVEEHFLDHFPPKDRDPGKILFVGRIHPEKGLELLLPAFRILNEKHPQASLTIVGPHDPASGGGGESFFRKLQTLSVNLPVNWHGPCFDLKALREIYHRHSLFVYPSIAEKGEAMPVAPLEAMACGLPPVISSLECFEDYIPEAIGFRFDPFDSAIDPATALAACFQKALSDPNDLARRSHEARSLAETFSTPVIADRFLNEFRRLLNGAESNDPRP